MSQIGVSQNVLFDRALIDHYDRSGPRYTSYPTAPHFHEGFGPDQFRQGVAQSAQENPDRPISIYIHIPFCDTVCYYCACNKVVTPDHSRVIPYLEYLFQEIAMMGKLFSRERKVAQLHLGGGTPTYLDSDQLQQLQSCLAEHFTLMNDDAGEYGIEVDPREMPPGKIGDLRKMGFNRISFGIQDLEYKVQKAVNRVQPLALNQRVVQEAREAGFQSVNLDLIYGLPLQTAESFQTTLKTVLNTLNPDRLAVFNYAHLPQYFMPQRRVNPEQLPSPETKLEILEQSIDILTRAGYVYVGMDHFAKPDDELAVAQRQGVLHRNFQGYTTHGDCDLVSMGSTAIGQIGRIYSQNQRELEGYYQRLKAGELPIFRGLQLTDDDLLRREVIMRLICDFQLDRKAVEERFHIVFDTYFARERNEIERMTSEGLLEDDGNLLRITPGGRLLIRNVCMAFDWHLNHAEQTKTFSKTI